MIPLVTTFLGGASLFYVGTRFQKVRYRLRDRRRRLSAPLLNAWPIRRVSIADLAPEFASTPWGPSAQTAIYYVPSGACFGGISDYEGWILSNFAKRANQIFEFGTCSGKTTYALASNSPKEAKVVTLTLHPDALDTYQEEESDRLDAKEAALQESCFTEFFYKNTPEERKITQLFGDSKAFDETPFLNTFDLIFVDGSHAYSYVMSDTEKALKMLKPGGRIFWHDYRGPKETKDVFKALNELNERLPLIHIDHTSLVTYQKRTDS